MSDADINDVFLYGLACAQLEETAECRRRHASKVGKRLESHFLLEVGIDIFLDSPYTSALGRYLHVGKRAARQFATFGIVRQFVEDLKQLDHSIEPWLCLGDLIKACVDAHDGREAECNAALCILEQLLDALHLTFTQECIAEEVWLELNGNLAHLEFFANILFPSVLKVTADECKIVLSEDLDRIAYYTTSSRTILNEVQFYLLVLVNGVSKTLFISVNEIKTVFLFERCYFGYDLVHGCGSVPYLWRNILWEKKMPDAVIGHPA